MYRYQCLDGLGLPVIVARTAQILLRDEGFALVPGDIAAGEGDGAFGDIFGADIDPQWDAAHFPIVELEPGGQLVAVIEFQADAFLRPATQL